ncbi:MAG: hypothetical protein AB7H97_02245, partial [Pseudobdellovibrionaceae bacterium]
MPHVLLFGCTLSESKNPLDPASICGGISASDVGIHLASITYQNAEYLSDGIHFNLSATIENCLGKDLGEIALAVTSTDGLTTSSTPSLNISKIERNGQSETVDLGSYVFDPLTSSPSITVSFTVSEDTYEYKAILDTSRLIPEFVSEMSNFQISDGPGLSNGDLLIDPGELVNFNLKLTNSSVTKLKGITANLSIASSSFAIPAGTALALGDISSGAGVTSATNSQIEVALAAARGHTTSLLISIADQFGHSWQKNISLQVSPTIPPPRKTQVLSLQSGMTFKGFATDATKWYLLVTETLGNNVTYFRLYQKSPSDTEFSHICSKLDDGHLEAHLAVDSNYFYIAQSGGIRRLNKTTCAAVDTITPSTGLASNATAFDSYSPFSLSVDSGLMYYAVSSTYDLASYNLTSTATSTHTTLQTLGTKSLIPSTSRFTVFNGTRWAYNISHDLIWKLDSTNTALAWGDVPASTYSDLNYVKAIATQDGNNIILATEQSSGTVRFRTFDVSGWTNSVSQASLINENEQAISTGTPVFPGCGQGRQITSNPGCLSVTDLNTTALPSGMTFKGFATDATKWYLLVTEALGNNVTYLRLYQKSPSDTEFSHICSKLDEGHLEAHLAVDANYFYIAQSGGIRRLSKTTCAAVDTVTPSTGLAPNATTFDYYSPFSLSVDSGFMYYAVPSTYNLASYNLTSTATSTHTTSQTLGTKSLSPSSTRFTVFNGTRWAYNSNNDLIWKLDSSNTALAWGQLPTSTYSDLNYVKAIATQDGNNIILATEQSSRTIKIFTFNVSEFQNSSGQTGAQVLTSPSTTMTSPFSSCSSGSYVSSSQQCYNLSSTSSTSIGAGTTFKGFTSDQTYFYLATENGSNIWTIFRKLPTDTTWSSLCSITDANLMAHLAVDANYFYIAQSGGIRRLSKTTCAAVDTVTPSTGLA